MGRNQGSTVSVKTIPADDLVIEELARSEAELRAMVDELLGDIATRDELISALLEMLNATEMRDKFKRQLDQERRDYIGRNGVAK